MESIQTKGPIEILLVEDDTDTGEAIRSALGTYGYSVNQVLNAHDCFEYLKKEVPALLLLDLELPDITGEKICNTLREQSFDTLPIIVLSGRDNDDAIVEVLEAGADDFVSKRNSISILVAHIRSVLKRGKRIVNNGPSKKHDAKVSWGPISIDRTVLKVSVFGRETSMTPTEAQLLEVFISHPGSVYTRKQLIENLHGAGYCLTERTIDVHINGIRNNLGEAKSVLETVRGVGYRLVEEFQGKV